MLRIGVAGAGHFGRYHALKVAASARCRLSGIYDTNAERAKTVGWEAGAQAMGWEELLATSDAVIIAAPAEAHYDLAAGALGASTCWWRSRSRRLWSRRTRWARWL
jgi:predicted dehydrogenase